MTTRVKVEAGSIPSASVGANTISLGNLSVANATAIQPGSGTMISGAVTPGPSALQNAQLYGTTVDCYEDVFKEITKKLNCNWDEAGGVTISDVLDSSNVVSSLGTSQPIVYDASDLFRTEATTSSAAATTLANNGGGGLAIVAAPGTNGLPAGAILVQRRLQDDKGRIWTIEGLPSTNEQIAFATVAAPGNSVSLQAIQPQQSTIVETAQPVPVAPQLQQNPQVTEERWFESDEVLSWTQSKIGRFNPTQKVFRCVDCDFVGFLSRVAEHWLGNHADYRVFQCPRCSYTSAWARCVRMHLSRQHGEAMADNSLWKENPVLEEVTKYLTTLKTKVEQKANEALNANGEKRYSCPYCPYQTDRRDLYNRHENIHRDDKPFQCYVCDKQFNRADHVKKHFMRIHREHNYDINKIRKHSGKHGHVQFFNGTKLASKPQQQRQQLQNRPQIQIQMQQVDQQQLLDPNQYANLQVKQEHDQSLAGLSLVSSQDIITVQSTNQIATVPHIAYFNPPPAPGQSGPLQGIPGVGGTKKEAKTKGHKKKKSGEKMYTCSYCPWQGVDNWCLKRHLNTHIKPFLCALCDYKAARSERLATHVLKVHNKRVCHKCSFLADDSESLSQHIQDSHQNPLVKTGFNCNICQEYFELRADLEAHAILEHQKVIVQCDLCDYRTTDELSMEAHLRDKHNLTPGSGAVAAAAAAAAAAAIGQHVNPPYVQTQVQTQLQLEPSPNQLLVQSGTVQTNPIPGPSAANIGTFASGTGNTQLLQSLKDATDVEAETDEPDTLCEKCGIDFMDEWSRKLHEKRHELVNPAEDEAVKAAKTATTKRFLRTYVCSTCSYTCSTKKMMMQHQRAHTGFELVCRAENCLFSTPFDNTLKEHIQNDHGTEEHVRCPHCGLRMPSCSAFTSHWRFHHRTVCSLCVNIYRVKYDVKENEIHDVICKLSTSSSTSISVIQDTDSSFLFKMDPDLDTFSLSEHHRFDEDLARLDLPDALGEPLMKRQKLDPSLTSSTATLYKRESIKFLPRLVEVNVNPMPAKVKRSCSRRRIRKGRGGSRRLFNDGADPCSVTAASSKKNNNSNTFINKYLKVIMKKEMTRSTGFSRVTPRRRYCQKGTFTWLYRNPREGYKCFSSFCENRCSWRYPRRSGLILHNLWYHRITRFKCDICGLRFSHFYKAFLHKINGHGNLLEHHEDALAQQLAAAQAQLQHQQIQSLTQAQFAAVVSPHQNHLLS